MKYKLKQIKWWFQKRICGYSDQDLWSMDYFLAEFLHKIMISFISAKRNGYPAQFEDHLEWEAVLLKIKEGFKSAIDLTQENYIDNYIIGYKDESFSCTDGSKTIMHNMPILDYDGIKNKELELKEKFNSSMDLFKEYFFNLWD